MITYPLDTIDIQSHANQLKNITTFVNLINDDFIVLRLNESPDPLQLTDPTIATHSGIFIITPIYQNSKLDHYMGVFYHPYRDNPIYIQFNDSLDTIYSTTSQGQLAPELAINPDDYDPIDTESYLKRLREDYPRYVRVSNEIKQRIMDRHRVRVTLSLPIIDPM